MGTMQFFQKISQFSRIFPSFPEFFSSYSKLVKGPTLQFLFFIFPNFFQVFQFFCLNFPNFPKIFYFSRIFFNYPKLVPGIQCYAEQRSIKNCYTTVMCTRDFVNQKKILIGADVRENIFYLFMNDPQSLDKTEPFDFNF